MTASAGGCRPGGSCSRSPAWASSACGAGRRRLRDDADPAAERPDQRADDDRLLRQRQDRDRPLRRAEPHHRPARPGARPRPEGGARRRGPVLLREPRHLADRHRPGLLEQPARRRHPGRVDDHPAVREERLPDAGADVHAQGQGVLHRGEARPPRRQGQDPRGLPEHHLLRPRRLRHRDGRADLLRQGRPSELTVERGRGPRRRSSAHRPTTTRTTTPRRWRTASTTCSTAWSPRTGSRPATVPACRCRRRPTPKKPQGRAELLPARLGPARAQGAGLQRPGHRPRRPARHHHLRPQGAALRRAGGPPGAAAGERAQRAHRALRRAARHRCGPRDVRRVDNAGELNEATQARVQPGSSFKPFALAGGARRRRRPASSRFNGNSPQELPGTDKEVNNEFDLDYGSSVDLDQGHRGRPSTRPTST